MSLRALLSEQRESGLSSLFMPFSVIDAKNCDTVSNIETTRKEIASVIVSP